MAKPHKGNSVERSEDDLSLVLQQALSAHDTVRDEEEESGLFTKSDLAKNLGLSKSGACNKIKDGIDQGLVEHAGFVTRTSIIGRTTKVPAYRLTTRDS